MPKFSPEVTQLREESLQALPRIGVSPIENRGMLTYRIEEIAFAVGALLEKSQAAGDPEWWRLADVLDDVLDVLDASRETLPPEPEGSWVDRPARRGPRAASRRS